MICNIRKPKEIEIEGTKLLVKPLTVLQRAELAELLKHDDNSHLKAIYMSVEWLFSNAVENITGLKDYEGCEVDFASANKKELAEGLEIGAATAVIDAVLTLDALPDSIKKKSSPPPPSGTG